AALAADIARAAEQDRPYVFVDIGANVGLFSLFVAARAGDRSRILAIEPEPGNLRRLTFNIGANPQAPVTALPIALSDEPGEVGIALDHRDRGGSRAMKVVPAEISIYTVRVPARTLLGVLSAERVDTIDALKIDVEGMEDVILQPFFRDAPQRLWPRLIIIEDSRAGWKVDLVSLLVANGYSMAERSKQNLVLRRAAIDGAGAGERQAAAAVMAKP
ncbi:MAG TPA: FkbM family methyltransferase, partial [Xanthobacteraceae bacterium]|nr:FkbM family methyltransferase [Xanthobacteraceae bacterium]